jgi:type I restriction enzyme, R subunit
LPDILAKSKKTPSFAESPTVDDNELVNLALEIDRVMSKKAPSGWRGDEAREKQVLNALFPVMQRDRETTMALFELLKNRGSY